MGLDHSIAKFLFERSKSAPLGRALILGRQNVYMTPSEVEDVRVWSGVSLRVGGFADDFFRALGATEISFLDRSRHEGADILHDLNRPIATNFHAQFDSVLDGGTLEHVFNLPVALKTCMEAVKKGGRLFIFSPANSMMGHGFYQFTPELFYRCLAPAYGFEVERVLIRHAGTWFEAKDPSDVGARVEAATPKPAALFVSARRESIRPIFESWPIQSDYADDWQPKASSSDHEGGVKWWIISRFSLLAQLQAKWRALKQARYKRLENPRLFRKLGPDLL